MNINENEDLITRANIVLYRRRNPLASLREIAQKCDVTVAKVRWWLGKSNILNHHSSGRPTSINQTMRSEIINLVTTNPYDSLRHIGSLSSISYEATRKILHQHHFEYLSPIVALPLLEHHKQKRVIFANEILSDDVYSSGIVFSDECYVMANTRTGKIWRIPGVYKEEWSAIKIDHSFSRMIWGAIGKNYKSPLVLLDGYVNAEKYVEIFDSKGIASNLKSHFGEYGFLLQHDNAKPHIAHHTIHEMNRLQIPMAPKWPARSPDLSPIEHLWDNVKNKIDGMVIHTQDELDDALIHAWNCIPLEMVNNYHSSFKARLQVCINHNGNCLNGKWGEVRELHHASN